MVAGIEIRIRIELEIIGVAGRHQDQSWVCAIARYAGGKLVDFELPQAAELIQAAARKSKFKPQSVELTLRGLCPDCNEVSRRSATTKK